MLPDISTRLLSAAERFRLKGDYSRAIYFYKKILSRTNFSKFSDNESYPRAEAFLGLGDLARVKGEFGNSRRNYIGALRIASLVLRMNSKRRSLKNFYPNDKTLWESVKFDASLGLVLCEKASGRYKSAYKKLNALFRRAKSLKDSKIQGFILWHIGMLLRFMGYPLRALATIGRALNICKKVDFSDGVAFCLCGMGGVLRVLGRTEESLKNYHKALKIFRRTKDAYGLAYSFCGSANALKTLGRFNEALRLYRRSERIYKKIGDISSLAFVYKGMADCYWGISRGLDSLPENEFSQVKVGFKTKDNFLIKSKKAAARTVGYYRLAEKFFKKSGDRRGLRLLYKDKK